MKSINDSIKSTYLLDKQQDGEGKIMKDNSITNNGPPLSQESSERHHDGSYKAVNEQKEFENLMRMSRELAHQLNNLLTTVLANTQLVSLMSRDEELRPYLKSVEDATRDAGTIVRDFQKALRSIANP